MHVHVMNGTVDILSGIYLTRKRKRVRSKNRILMFTHIYQHGKNCHHACYNAAEKSCKCVSYVGASWLAAKKIPGSQKHSFEFVPETWIETDGTWRRRWRHARASLLYFIGNETKLHVPTCTCLLLAVNVEQDYENEAGNVDLCAKTCTDDSRHKHTSLGAKIRMSTTILSLYWV